jgi:2-aminoadipate transaminase
MTPHEDRFSAAARGLRFSAIRRLSALIERPGIISFAPGQPSPETFPVAALRALADSIIEKESASAFQYILTRGLGPLLEEIGRYAEAKGIRSTPGQRMLTEGSQQGLDLVSRVLLDPGDVVLVELPSYIGATSAFRASRARLEGVRLTEEGLDLEHLRWRHREITRAGGIVKFLYVIPNFQNPSGITHSAASRAALLEAARELDLLVVEDDPYGDVYFEDVPPTTLRAMDGEDGVLYLSSFSKILAPGLRTAFLLGPEEVMAKVEIAKQSANLCGSGLDQRLVLGCLRGGLIEQQKERIRPYYRDKCRTMLDALAAEMPEGTHWTRPTGGLFVWLTLREPLNADEMLQSALDEGVAYVPGSPFFVDGTGPGTMRLTFAKETAENIVEGVRRLARAVRRALPTGASSPAAGPGSG